MKVLDLFSGIGGFSLGLERTGHYETVAFCEIEGKCVDVLNKHWPTVKVHNDITKLNGDLFDNVDVITGGFPCQDISIAGKGAGIKGAKSGLWSEYKRLIEEVKPKYAIIENVSALLGRGLSTILQDLAQIGYDATWTTYDTKFFGLPQRRRRVYILAVRDGVPSDADIFQLGQRDTAHSRQQVERINESHRWNYAKSDGDKHTFAFFTRQRSNEFSCSGLSGTLAKRDYKSFTDLVSQNGVVRRVTPEERMLLQGFPADWLDVEGLTDTNKFTMNGMSVPVVQEIGELLNDFQLQHG